ncbi:Inactive Ufm1-specific protease 1 [Intoshia linei]|uniref:Inactive Ufm1-specific protease 1 n=1 Tax=Intoshia linei TaxID=1819745 RepID=A0A177AVQ5_9BILA|nr:Inactive Ufm1-specific protease 1 [Intoshia linei]
MSLAVNFPVEALRIICVSILFVTFLGLPGLFNVLYDSGLRRNVDTTLLDRSICLAMYLWIDSKIIHLTNGAEIVENFSVLIGHFQTVGSPIMIGGACLAHTIIGVSLDIVTGELKFLVLDPHYDNKNVSKSIIKKSWVGWKDSSFWSFNTFYNLCLPQLPICKGENKYF